MTRRSLPVTAPWIMGLDLSLTSAGIVVLPPSWEPGEGWQNVVVKAIGYDLKRGCSAEERVERLLTIVDAIGDTFDDVIDSVGVELFPTIQVFVEDYSYGMAFGAHQLGELGGCVRLHFWRRGVLVRPVNHTSARKLVSYRSDRCW